MCIKRVIEPDGSKYYQNNKQVERIEIRKYFEMLGFAKTYPFYCFVKENDIDTVINMNVLDRSMLVKKMAGLDDFLKSKEKSLRILSETKEELTKITDYLQKIEIQLEIHETETTQWEYNSSLEKKKAIEHRMQLLEDEEVEKQIENLQHEITSENELKEQYMAEIMDLDKNLKEIRQKMRLNNPENFKLMNEKFPIQKRRNDLASQLETLESTIRSLEEQLQSQEYDENHAQQELELIEISVEKKMDELNDLRVQKHKIDTEYTKISRQRNQLQAQFNDVFSRSEQNQRLGRIFTNKNERDRWMNDELKETIRKLKNENIRLKKTITGIEKEQNNQSKLRSELVNSKAQLASLGSPLDIEKREKDGLQRKNILEKELK